MLDNLKTILFHRHSLPPDIWFFQKLQMSVCHRQWKNSLNCWLQSALFSSKSPAQFSSNLWLLRFWFCRRSCFPLFQRLAQSKILIATEGLIVSGVILQAVSQTLTANSNLGNYLSHLLSQIVQEKFYGYMLESDVFKQRRKKRCSLCLVLVHPTNQCVENNAFWFNLPKEMRDEHLNSKTFLKTWPICKTWMSGTQHSYVFTHLVITFRYFTVMCTNVFKNHVF